MGKLIPNGLYPIIRRVRRPLLPVEGAAIPQSAPAKALAGGHQAAPATAPNGQQPAQTDTASQRAKEEHGETTSTEPAQ